eukprot:3411659-Lingulodinium_polyedra.AAC.1
MVIHHSKKSLGQQVDDKGPHQVHGLGLPLQDQVALSHGHGILAGEVHPETHALQVLQGAKDL